jgi:hypothetical protein
MIRANGELCVRAREVETGGTVRGNDMDSNSKKPGGRFMWTGVGVGLGAGIGLSIGILFFDAFPVFMAIGAGVGVALGAAFDQVAANNRKRG